MSLSSALFAMSGALAGLLVLSVLLLTAIVAFAARAQILCTDEEAGLPSERTRRALTGGRWPGRSRSRDGSIRGAA